LQGRLQVAEVLSLMDAEMVSMLSQLSPEVAGEAMRYHLETRVSNVSKPNSEHMELGPVQSGLGHNLSEVWGPDAPFQIGSPSGMPVHRWYRAQVGPQMRLCRGS